MCKPALEAIKHTPATDGWLDERPFPLLAIVTCVRSVPRPRLVSASPLTTENSNSLHTASGVLITRNTRTSPCSTVRVIRWRICHVPVSPTRVVPAAVTMASCSACATCVKRSCQLRPRQPHRDRYARTYGGITVAVPLATPAATPLTVLTTSHPDNVSVSAAESRRAHAIPRPTYVLSMRDLHARIAESPSG